MKQIEEITFADTGLLYFSSFIFFLNHGFIQEGDPSEKVFIAEQELDGTDMDDIGVLKHTEFT